MVRNSAALENVQLDGVNLAISCEPFSKPDSFFGLGMEDASLSPPLFSHRKKWSVNVATMPLANDVSSLDVNIAGATRRALSFDLPQRDKRVPKQSSTPFAFTLPSPYLVI